MAAGGKGRGWRRRAAPRYRGVREAGRRSAPSACRRRWSRGARAAEWSSAYAPGAATSTTCPFGPRGSSRRRC
eukprot:10569206-Lingulodinium_polyedra.AAC.1